MRRRRGVHQQAAKQEGDRETAFVEIDAEQLAHVFAVPQWLRDLGNPYAVVAEDREGRTAIDWGVYGAPETFLIGADGVVLFKHIAPMTMEVWNKEFLPRIEASRAAAGSQS